MKTIAEWSKLTGIAIRYLSQVTGKSGKEKVREIPHKKLVEARKLQEETRAAYKENLVGLENRVAKLEDREYAYAELKELFSNVPWKRVIAEMRKQGWDKIGGVYEKAKYVGKRVYYVDRGGKTLWMGANPEEAQRIAKKYRGKIYEFQERHGSTSIREIK